MTLGDQMPCRRPHAGRRAHRPSLIRLGREVSLHPDSVVQPVLPNATAQLDSDHVLPGPSAALGPGTCEGPDIIVHHQPVPVRKGLRGALEPPRVAAVGTGS